MVLRENAHDVLSLAVMAEVLQFEYCETLDCSLWSDCVSQYAGLRPNRYVSIHTKMIKKLIYFTYSFIQ